MYTKWKVIRAVCKSLCNGAGYEDSAKAAGISWMTLWRWRKKDPRLDQILSACWDSCIGIVEDAQMKSAVRGNVMAQQFFLTNRAKNRWRRDPEAVINFNSVEKQLILVTPNAVTFSENTVDVEPNVTDIHAEGGTSSALPAPQPV